MKENIKIAILSFFILILSALNLKAGLIFKTTDTAERDAFQKTHETLEKDEKVTKPSLRKVNIPAAPKKTTTKTYAVASATTKKSYSPKNYDYSKISTKKINCNSSMPETSGINYCHYQGANAIFAYGHNRSGVFASLANLKQNDTFTINVDGKVRKYRVINNFTIKLSTLNPPKNSSEAVKKKASALRTSLYLSTYGGKYDITLQTCAGANDSYRRYVQAVAI